MQSEEYKKLSKELKDNLSRLMQKRQTWESHWQEVADYMLTRRADIVQVRARGDKRNVQIFDATAVHSLEMLASSFCEYSGADFGIAESGLAGPKTSQRSEKSIGSVVIAVKSPGGVESESKHFEGNRIEIMSQAADCALEMLYESILKYKYKSV